MDIKNRKEEKQYKPQEVEKKWQKIWEEKGVYKPNLDLPRGKAGKAAKPFYNLMMFPYPSAEGLHAGNMYAFTGADIYGRFQRMKGNDVFEPIGLDGFGIHSENYALKIGKNPMDQAKISEQNFYRQLHAIGNGYDWHHKLETYDPNYYKWTQWIFVQMFKKGLAYRKKSAVNFCPSCKTVLADEQVIAGLCERCSSVVEKRELEQWFFKITEYAERLLNNIEKLNWSEKVKIAQRNWIGKKEGINIDYPVFDQEDKKAGIVTCFTTRPDTNFGATFVVIAPEHPFVASLLNSKFKIQNSKLAEIENYVERAKKKSDQERIAEGREKTGVFTGLYCLNQLNNYKMPLYISDFVLSGFGTGAVVGVPGHDKRDFEFAKKFNLPIIRVVLGKNQDKSDITEIDQVQEEEGLMINSEFLNGLDIHEATKTIMDYLEKKGWGKRLVTYHIRDWLISRQRYWGPPIPMIFCEVCAKKGLSWFNTKESRIVNHESREKEIHNSEFIIQNSNESMGWFPVPEKDLPVILPRIEDYRPVGTGKAPLANHPDFYNTTCPNCNGKAVRETDVSDTFLDSAWYFFRYICTECENVPFPSEAFVQNSKSETRNPKQIKNLKFKIENSAQRTERWLPVDMYIGGAEHSVLHLLYSRFTTMFFHDLGLIDFEEPYKRFYAHGLLIKEGAKMSKSKGNVVVPDEYINKFGADTVRCYLMFLGPFSQGGDFYDTGIEGMNKFLKRVWNLIINKVEIIEKERDEEVLKSLNKTIEGVSHDIERLFYNTSISKLMEFYNSVSNKKVLGKDAVESFLKMLAPFAPHMTEEIYQNVVSSSLRLSELNEATIHETERGGVKDLVVIRDSSPLAQNDKGFQSIHKQLWPLTDNKYLKQEQTTIVIQINGKVRDSIKVQSSKFKVQSYVEAEAAKKENVKKYLEGKTIKKVIYVPGKIINFVLDQNC